MSLPNLLTIARIVAIPIVVWLVLAGTTPLGWMAFALYVAAAVTDYVDGYLARRMGAGSSLGTMLDPIADKMLVGALIVTFAATGQLTGIDLVPALAIVLREIFISGLREYMGGRQVTVAVSALAKYKTATQLVAVGLVMLEPLVAGISLLAELVLWAAAALTVWTGYRYFAGVWRHLREPVT